MNDPTQAWWGRALIALGGLLFTVRWLIKFGEQNAYLTIQTQAQEIIRLRDSVEKLTSKIEALCDEMSSVREENARLRMEHLSA
jgi:predicted nuclease with TOPRIM domain